VIPNVVLSVPVLIAALALVFASTAAAGPPATAVGTYTVTSVAVESMRTAGGNTFTSATFSGVYAGDLSGPFTAEGVVKTTGSGDAFVGHGTLVCTGCTVAGRTGDFTAEISNQSADPKMGGIVTVLSATGGLAGLHAVNHFEGTPYAGTTSWSYHFDP
jgi:hypothetical protein